MTFGDAFLEVILGTTAQGDMMIIRYADDTVLGFEYEQEEKRFLQDMQERLQAFSLTLDYYIPILVTASTFVLEGGAQCVISARWDLRGGCRVTGIPTATIHHLIN